MDLKVDFAVVLEKAQGPRSRGAEARANGAVDEDVEIEARSSILGPPAIARRDADGRMRAFEDAWETFDQFEGNGSVAVLIVVQVRDEAGASGDGSRRSTPVDRRRPRTPRWHPRTGRTTGCEGRSVRCREEWRSRARTQESAVLKTRWSRDNADRMQCRGRLPEKPRRPVASPQQRWSREGPTPLPCERHSTRADPEVGSASANWSGGTSRQRRPDHFWWLPDYGRPMIRAAPVGGRQHVGERHACDDASGQDGFAMEAPARPLRIAMPLMTLVPGGMGGTQTFVSELARGLRDHRLIELIVARAPCRGGSCRARAFPRG